MYSDKLGIFGAILGYGGYAQKEWKKEKKGQSIEVDYPEFYEKLRHIKVSVVPKNERGYIPKKVQIFNNSVGYASDEQGDGMAAVSGSISGQVVTGADKPLSEGAWVRVAS